MAQKQNAFSFLILIEKSTTGSLHIGPSQVSGSRVASENQATRAKCETSNSCGEFHAKGMKNYLFLYTLKLTRILRVCY